VKDWQSSRFVEAIMDAVDDVETGNVDWNKH
jgi:hypothetical protein